MSETDLSWLGTTVVVWAHPDDETYLSGGTAAALVDLGHRVVAVTATRGEAGGPDTTPAGRAETARLRTAELEEALRAAGRGRAHLARLRGRRLRRRRPRTRRTTTGEPVRRRASRHRPVLRAGRLHRAPGPPDRERLGGHRAGPQRRGTPPAARRRHRAGPRRPGARPGLRGLRARPAPDRASRRSWRCGTSSTGPPCVARWLHCGRRRHRPRGLIEAVGLDRFTAWVAVEAFADPALRVRSGTLRPHGPRAPGRPRCGWVSSVRWPSGWRARRSGCPAPGDAPCSPPWPWRGAGWSASTVSSTRCGRTTRPRTRRRRSTTTSRACVGTSAPPAERLARHGAGYVLELGDDELDANVVRAVVDELSDLPPDRVLVRAREALGPLARTGARGVPRPPGPRHRGGRARRAAAAPARRAGPGPDRGR